MRFVCLDLVNSEEWDGYGQRTDHLTDPAWVARFLGRLGMTDSVETTTHLVEQLAHLRALLRRILEAIAQGGQVSDADIAALNAVLRAAPAQRHVARDGDDFHVELVPLARDEHWLLGQIAASAAELLAATERRRIKVCANAGCRWAFYDTTRGNTRRWCNDQTCGNRDKVRRFRARRKGTAAR